MIMFARRWRERGRPTIDISRWYSTQPQFRLKVAAFYFAATGVFFLLFLGAYVVTFLIAKDPASEAHRTLYAWLFPILLIFYGIGSLVAAKKFWEGRRSAVFWAAAVNAGIALQWLAGTSPSIADVGEMASTTLLIAFCWSALRKAPPVPR